MGCHALFQGMFPNQVSNPGLPHCGQILYQLSYQGSSDGIILNLLISSTSLRDRNCYHRCTGEEGTALGELRGLL